MDRLHLLRRPESQEPGGLKLPPAAPRACGGVGCVGDIRALGGGYGDDHRESGTRVDVTRTVH